MIARSKRGCLSQLLFVAAVCTFFYVLLTHMSSEAIPIPWQSVKAPLLWMFGLAFLFKLISPRRKTRIPEKRPDFVVEVNGVNVETPYRSNDISASARQLEYIKALGGKPKKGMSLAEASAMIDKLKIERDVKRQEEVARRVATRKAKGGM